jgi:hypothetical protein
VTRLSPCLVFALITAPLSAQQPATYRPQADTQFMMVINPYHMYWVRGSDTLSQPALEAQVETEVWRQVQGQLEVFDRVADLNTARTVKYDTFTVSPRGVIQPLNGRVLGFKDDNDLVPHLPDRPLVPGTAWSDTVQTMSRGPAGDGVLALIRDFRVQRVFDSAGTQLAEVAATGTAHYRDSWWVDSAAGKLLSIDAIGPHKEGLIFAIREGRLVSRWWSMNLVGRGVIPGPAGLDTVAAGLVSAQSESPISRERAHLLTRDLPGADTTFTFNRGVVFVHTVQHDSAHVASGMARADGLVGTADARYQRGSVRSFAVTWTDTSATARRISLSASRDSLRLTDMGHADTVLVAPTPWWGVADYAMGELLIPTFLAHASDTAAAPFAIYRPYPRHWDTGTAKIRPLGEYLLASYRLGSDTAATYFLISRSGELLMGENSDPTGAERMPAEGTPKRATLDAFLKSLQSR